MTLQAIGHVIDRFLHFGLSDRLRVYRLIASMLSDGKPLDASLNRLHKQWAKRKHPLARMLHRWLHGPDGSRNAGLLSGNRFSDVIRSDVPSQELFLISAGERSLELVTGLQKAVMVTQGKAAIKKAMIPLVYPSLVLAMVIFMSVLFSIKLIPIMVKTLPAENWMGLARLLYLYANFVRNFWLVGGIAIVLIAMLSVWSLPRLTSPIRKYLNHIPPWSIYQTYETAAFMISLSSLLSTGIPLTNALASIREHAPRWTSTHITEMLYRIQAGKPYGEAIDTGFLDVNTADLVYIYAEGTEFDKGIMQIGERSIDEALESIKAKAAVANPIILALAGGIIALLVSGFYAESVQAQNAMRARREHVSLSAPSLVHGTPTHQYGAHVIVA